MQGGGSPQKVATRQSFRLLFFPFAHKCQPWPLACHIRLHVLFIISDLFFSSHSFVSFLKLNSANLSNCEISPRHTTFSLAFWAAFICAICYTGTGISEPTLSASIFKLTLIILLHYFPVFNLSLQPRRAFYLLFGCCRTRVPIELSRRGPNFGLLLLIFLWLLILEHEQKLMKMSIKIFCSTHSIVASENSSSQHSFSCLCQTAMVVKWEMHLPR